jgi:Apea-like HEPN
MSPGPIELPTDILGLLHTCIERVRRQNQEGGIKLQRHEVLKPKVDGIVYERDRKTFMTKYERILRHSWDSNDLRRYLEEVVVATPEFIECEVALRQAHPNCQADVSKILLSLVGIASAEAAEPGQEESLPARVEALLDDLRMAPAKYKVKVWIDGLFMEDELVEFGESLTLRRPRPSDFEEEQSADPLVSRYSTDLGTGIPAAILEFEYRAQQTNLVQERVAKLSELLCLFRLGAIKQLKCTITSYSFRMFLMPGTISFGGTGGSSPEFQYTIRGTDAEHLDRFYKAMIDVLPPDPSFNPEERSNILIIPFPRFKDGLHGGAYESRITSAITCLEGLYFKPEEISELAHRLGQRVAVTLRHFGHDPSQVFDTIGKAYKIRSRFVHGDFIPEKHLKDALSLCRTVLEYARISLVVAMQLRLTNKEAKKLHLEELDQAMIEPVRNDGLRERFVDRVVLYS